MTCSNYYANIFLPTIAGEDDFSGIETFPSSLFPMVTYKVETAVLYSICNSKMTFRSSTEGEPNEMEIAKFGKIEKLHNHNVNAV